MLSGGGDDESSAAAAGGGGTVASTGIFHSAMHLIVVGLAATTANPGVPNCTVSTFTQPLDHFDFTEGRQWQQRRVMAQRAAVQLLRRERAVVRVDLRTNACVRAN